MGKDGNDEEYLQIDNVPIKLTGKNRFKWTGQKGKLHRQPNKNLVIHLPGNKGEATKLESGLEAWKLCFTNLNLDLVTEYTNKTILIQQQNYKTRTGDEHDLEKGVTGTPSFTRITNSVEIQALIGLLYYAGLMKLQGPYSKELLDKDSGIPIFRATMSEARFTFLINSSF